MISQTPGIGGTSNQLRWEKECGGNAPSFWCEFWKTLPSQNGIFLTFQNYHILDLLPLCICQYNSYGNEKLYSTVHVHGSWNLLIWEIPWKLDDISDPWHRGNLKSAQVGEGMWRKRSQLLVWVLKNPSFSKWDIPNLPNYHILDLLPLCICQYNSYGNEKLYSTVHVHGSWNLLIWKIPWKLDDISDPWHRGNLKSAQVGEGMWRKRSQLLVWVLKNPSFSKWDIPNLPKLWHFGPSAFMYLSHYSYGSE